MEETWGQIKHYGVVHDPIKFLRLLFNGASVRRSLFSEETSSMANKVTQPKFAGGLYL